jgi:hypothetical protein
MTPELRYENTALCRDSLRGRSQELTVLGATNMQVRSCPASQWAKPLFFFLFFFFFSSSHPLHISLLRIADLENSRPKPLWDVFRCNVVPVVLTEI